MTTSERPNILFLFPDQWRWDWLEGTPGLPVRTPHLATLARRGMHFGHAISPSPLCAPCRACLATGQDFWHGSVPSNGVDLPPAADTVYRRLRESGYHVMGCGKFDLHKATLDWGLDGSRCLPEWGFSDGIDNEGKWDGVISGQTAPKGPYLSFLETNGWRRTHLDDMARRKGIQDATFPTSLPEAGYCDNFVGENALTLLRRAPARKPWFLQVNFTGPHDPWDITETMAEWYAGATFAPPLAHTRLAPEAHQRIRRNYAAMIENIDRWVGRLVAELHQRGELERTLIVFASDHGEMLGDHDRFGKSVPFHGSIGVPLIVAGPGVRAGTRSDAPTTILDLAATFLDTAGLSLPPTLQSRSLAPALAAGRGGPRTVVTSALGNWQAAYDGRYKLIRQTDAAPQLFDLKADPAETTNLAQAPALASILARLQAELDTDSRPA